MKNKETLKYPGLRVFPLIHINILNKLERDKCGGLPQMAPRER